MDFRAEITTLDSFRIRIIRVGYGWTIGVLGFDSRRGWEFFSSLPRPERLWGPPASYPMDIGVCFAERKAAVEGS